MPKKKKPAYTQHKPTGQARVRLNGKDHYLGLYGSQESRDEYDALLLEWLLHNGDTRQYTLTVDELAILFMNFAKGYYRKDGQPTSEIACYRAAFRPLIRLFGTTRVREFGPRMLKTVRNEFIAAGYVRTSINSMVTRIRRLFKWGVADQFVPAEVYQALCAVDGLKEGRCDAPESDPVEPVDEETVAATAKCLPRVVQAMVNLQLLTGARPGEITQLRPGDVTFAMDGVWVYRPRSHKTQHHGRARPICIGPKAQDILRPFLNREADAFCFSPREAMAELRATRRANRQSPMTPSQAARKPKCDPGRKPTDRYSKGSYRRAIVRACEVAFGMPEELRIIPKSLPIGDREKRRLAAADWRKEFVWHPNQLRHTRATLIEDEFGLKAAQVVLGHSNPKTTKRYAKSKRDFRKAARIMREIG